MRKKQYLFIALIVILAGLVAYFYFSGFNLEKPSRKTEYSTEDFPNALKTMDEHILEITVAGLNKEYSRLVNQDDDKNYWTWIEIGILKRRLNDYVGAEAAWQEARKVNPSHALAVGNLADLYLYHIQDYNKAEEYYIKAIEMNPYYYDYFYGLASLYRYNMTEKADRIEELMVGGANQTPSANERANYYMYLAHYFAKEGNNKEKAKQYIEKTLEFNPILKDQLPDL